MTTPLFKLIFREKPTMLLLTLINTQTEIYASIIAKKIDCTYSHIIKILKEMEIENLIEFKKKGRLKIIILTKKGEDIAKNINALYRLI